MTIRQKQWQLYYLGYYTSTLDGIWGLQSIEATKQFQKEHALKIDGIFGPETIEKSRSLISSIQKRITDGKIAIDGLAGSETKDATVMWQIAHNIPATGIADTFTQQEIILRHPSLNNFWSNIKHFSKQEFKCKCGTKYCNGYPAEINSQLISTAEKIRTSFNAPAFISSGLRCSQHNANVGGVSNSRHLSGKAMDFRIEGVSAKKLHSFVKSIPEIRYCYIIDSSYVHIDVY